LLVISSNFRGDKGFCHVLPFCQSEIIPLVAATCITGRHVTCSKPRSVTTRQTTSTRPNHACSGISCIAAGVLGIRKVALLANNDLLYMWELCLPPTRRRCPYHTHFNLPGTPSSGIRIIRFCTVIRKTSTGKCYFTHSSPSPRFPSNSTYRLTCSDLETPGWQ
jgi:hypothetical protein